MMLFSKVASDGFHMLGMEMESARAGSRTSVGGQEEGLGSCRDIIIRGLNGGPREKARGPILFLGPFLFRKGCVACIDHGTRDGDG